MAKKTIEKYFSDLSGIEIHEGGATVTFAFDGRGYEIDLTPAERSELESTLQRWVDAARPSGGHRTSSSRVKSGPDPKAVREWARSNGHDVPERGRIPATVQDAYAAAH